MKCIKYAVILEFLLSCKLELPIKLLDIGCYDLLFFDQLKFNNLHKKIIYYGIDVHLSVPKPEKCNLSVANIENAPFKDESFDCIVFSGMIGWRSWKIMNPMLALAEIHRILKDDGILFASCWNSALIKRLIDFFFIHPPNLIYMLDEKLFEKMMNEADFDVIKFLYFPWAKPLLERIRKGGRNLNQEIIAAGEKR
ncbi:MAG: class I SAM-dependent methyltransferase [Thermoplasmatales archaeon]|nr:class I SAM-dependent methyltransferase [Thermoplasmatales archaeon]